MCDSIDILKFTYASKIIKERSSLKSHFIAHADAYDVGAAHGYEILETGDVVRLNRDKRASEEKKVK